MIRRAHIASVAAALTALVAAGCGGGGGSSTAGIDGTGVTPNTYAFGAVTAFGSVFVNGVRFDTSNASFTIDGQPGSQADLAVGDVVLVVGTMNAGSTTNGTASSVTFDDAVEGSIETGSIDTTAGTFVVLGQLVRVSADTSFDDSIQPASLAGLSDGDVVEVSGFSSSDGSIRATRIEVKSAGTGFDVMGLVSGLDTVGSTFMINALSVDYSTAMLQDFPSGAIAEGDLVEVKGMTLSANGELLATTIEFKGGALDPGDGDDVELEGFITRFSGTADFDVSGFPVTTTVQTTYEGGTAADLGLDLKVEVDGSVNASGVLVAEKVDIRRASAVRIAAVIDSVDASSSSFVTLGITVKVDSLTRIEDKRDGVTPFSIANLTAGDYVEVRGSEFPAGSGELIAGLVERDKLDADTELRGFVQSASDPVIEILGVSVATNGNTSFKDEAEASISAATFFGQVASGSLVEVKGLETGPQSILADEVSFENE